MKLVEQWLEIEAGLPENWSGVELLFGVAEDERADQAALILASFAPGRTGSSFRILVQRGQDPARVLRRLDDQGIRGRVDLVGAEAPAREQARAPERERPLAEQWDELVGEFPPDWSDLGDEPCRHAGSGLARRRESSVNEPEVSWKSIQKGARVHAVDNQELGKVVEIAGDTDADIFSGLVVSLSRLSSNRFLPSERVTAIWPDRVATSVASDEVESLTEYKRPVAERWQPPGPGFLRRLFGRD